MLEMPMLSVIRFWFISYFVIALLCLGWVWFGLFRFVLLCAALSCCAPLFPALLCFALLCSALLSAPLLCSALPSSVLLSSSLPSSILLYFVLSSSRLLCSALLSSARISFGPTQAVPCETNDSQHHMKCERCRKRIKTAKSKM
jgi:hypothetical protein